jgi:hypothetical protein
MKLDGEKFGQEVVTLVRGFLERELKPIREENEEFKRRIAELEARPAPEKGEPGKDGEAPAVADIVAAVEPTIKEMVDAAAALIPAPKDGEPGKDGLDGVGPTVEDVTAALEPVVKTLVTDAVALIPAPKDGEPGKDGLDGVSPTVEDVTAALEPVVKSLVTDAVALIPAPKDGEPGKDGLDGVSPALEDVTAALEPVVKGLVDDAVALIPAPKDGEPGKDGRGIKSMLIDRDGELIATMDDGALVKLGPVVGRDGLPGQNGTDGKDGFSLEDFDCKVLEDDRTIELSFKSGDYEHVATIKFPAMMYRGIFKDGSDYEAGDSVTWGGSLWVAVKATNLKPDVPDSGWTLAVKKGRDGKDMRKET